MGHVSGDCRLTLSESLKGQWTLTTPVLFGGRGYLCYPDEMPFLLHVIARGTREEIVTTPTREIVVAGITIENVVTLTTNQDTIAQGTEEEIIARTPSTVSFPSEELIESLTPLAAMKSFPFIVLPKKMPYFYRFFCVVKFVS